MQNIEQPLLFIEETHIGNLFLQSRTWKVHVLRRALNELQPLMAGHAAAIECPDNSIDLIFCHQTFHHVIEQEQALQEFFRILRPGGVLLFAESTKRYIHSLLIKVFFRHPMHVQKTAEEYRAMIRAAGFDLPDEKIAMPFLWWSRPDLGALEWLGLQAPGTPREETLFNAMAVKPPLA